MKVALSGVTRKERLDLLVESGTKNIVLDFCLAKTLDKKDLEKVCSQFDWVLLDYDLSSSWSRYKSLWMGNPSLTLLGKSKSVTEAKEKAIVKLTNKVQAYCDFALEFESLFSVVSIPYLPIPEELGWEKLLKTKVSMVTVRDLSELDTLVTRYSYVAFTKDIDLPLLKAKISSLKASLRSFNCKTHMWGRADKETARTGLIWSSSTSNWLSGTKYGNTYEYVGNLKLNIHHSKSKDIRRNLKAKCLSLKLDHDLLLQDDRYTVNLWNLAQYQKFSSDCEKVIGYWTESTKTTNIVKSEPKVLASTVDTERYLRSCNSCFLSSQCPLFEPDYECRVTTTTPVNTPDDIQSLLNKVIQIQSDRVVFSAFAERVQNAGIDPQVSKELQTLTKLMRDAREITSPVNNDEVLIKAKGSGVISRLFGSYGRTGGGSKPSTSEMIIDVSPLEDE